MKKIYQASFDMDCGEIWLNDKFEPIGRLRYDEGDINCNHEFIFKELGAELVRIYIVPIEEDIDFICRNDHNAEAIFNRFEYKIRDKAK